MKPDQISSVDKAHGICVEIGTWEGAFTKAILSKSNVVKVFCVDPYEHFLNNEYPDSMNNLTQNEFDVKFNNTYRNLSKQFGNRVEFIRQPSSVAATLFADNSLDYIYIDGNHDYKYVLEDLKLWYPKLKVGGYLCGDDVYSTNLSEHDVDGNITIKWSDNCWGKYGTYKALTDFGKQFTIIETQFYIIKELNDLYLNMIPTFVSYGNFPYYDFCDNLITSLIKNAKGYKLIFYCLDLEIFNKLNKKYNNANITFELFDNKESQTDFSSYGSNNFNKITLIKLKILIDALTKYNYIHFVDSDVVLLRELSIDYYKEYTCYDIVFQKDAPHTPPDFCDTWACTGNFTLKNTKETRDLIEKLIDYHSKHLNMNDQECLREIFRSENINDIREYKHAKLFQFPPEDFVCGFYMKDQTPREDHVNPNNAILFHANHVVGREAKICLLKKAGGWFI